MGNKCAKVKSKSVPETKRNGKNANVKRPQNPHSGRTFQATVEKYLKERRKRKEKPEQREQPEKLQKPVLSFCCKFGPSKTAPSVTPEELEFASRRPRLAQDEMVVVVKSLNLIECYLNQVGKKTFMDMFTELPEQMRYFSKFANVYSSPPSEINVFAEHANLVMGVLVKVIEHFQEGTSPFSLLHEVGCIHLDSQVSRKAVFLIVPFLVSSVSYYYCKHKKGVWTDELDKAWTKLLNFICHVIGEKMLP